MLGAAPIGAAPLGADASPSQSVNALSAAVAITLGAPAVASTFTISALSGAVALTLGSPAIDVQRTVVALSSVVNLTLGAPLVAAVDVFVESASVAVTLGSPSIAFLNLYPERDVRLALEGQTIDDSTPTTGVDLFQGPVRHGVGPALCFFVQCPMGAPPSQYLDGGIVSTFRATVDVWVRGTIEAYGVGRLTARAALRFLHLRDVPGYVSCRALTTEPQHEQWLEEGAHLWRVPVELTWVEAVTIPFPIPFKD